MKIKPFLLIITCMMIYSAAYGANPKDSTDTVDHGTTKALAKPRPTATGTTDPSTFFPYTLASGTGSFYIGNSSNPLPTTFNANLLSPGTNTVMYQPDVQYCYDPRNNIAGDGPPYTPNSPNQALVTTLSKICQSNFNMNVYFTIKDITVVYYSFCFSSASTDTTGSTTTNYTTLPYYGLPYDLSGGYDHGTFEYWNSYCISYTDPNPTINPQYYPIQYGNSDGSNGVPSGYELLGSRQLPLPNAIKVTQLTPTPKFVPTSTGTTELYVTPPPDKPIAYITTPLPPPIVAARPPMWAPTTYQGVDVVSPVYNRLPYYSVVMKLNYDWEVRCEN